MALPVTTYLESTEKSALVRIFKKTGVHAILEQHKGGVAEFDAEEPKVQRQRFRVGPFLKDTRAS